MARQDQLIVRPKIPWNRQLMFSILFGGWLLLMGVGLVFIFPTHRVLLVGCMASLVAVFLAGGVELYSVGRFSRLRVDRDALTLVRPPGLSRKFPRSSLAQIARVTFEFRVRTSITFSYFVFVGANGRVVFKLPAKWWPDAGIVAVGHALEFPVTGSFFEVLDGPAFRHEFPGSIPWVVAHPRLAACTVGLLSLPALVLIVLAILILQGKA